LSNFLFSKSFFKMRPKAASFFSGVLFEVGAAHPTFPQPFTSPCGAQIVAKGTGRRPTPVFFAKLSFF
jgi:hypothetical protein